MSSDRPKDCDEAKEYSAEAFRKALRILKGMNAGMPVDHFRFEIEDLCHWVFVRAQLDVFEMVKITGIEDPKKE